MIKTFISKLLGKSADDAKRVPRIERLGVKSRPPRERAILQPTRLQGLDRADDPNHAAVDLSLLDGKAAAQLLLPSGNQTEHHHVHQRHHEPWPRIIAAHTAGRLNVLGGGLRLPKHDHQAEARLSSR